MKTYLNSGIETIAVAYTANGVEKEHSVLPGQFSRSTTLRATARRSKSN